MEQPIVELRGVTKQFKEKTIFKNFNFAAFKGESICITGKSGSGKSTVLNMIGLIDNDYRGKLYIEGKEVKGINSRNAIYIRRNQIDYLFQNYALVDEETVEQNLLTAIYFQKQSQRSKRKMIQKVLTSVGLTDKQNKKIYTLSGGEQQRVSIARAMLRNNPILLADELTGSLDEQTRDEILKLLEPMKDDPNKTLIFVSHDQVVANWCDRIVHMD